MTDPKPPLYRITPKTLREAGACRASLLFLARLYRLSGLPRDAAHSFTREDLERIQTLYTERRSLLANHPMGEWHTILQDREKHLPPELAKGLGLWPEALLRIGFYAHHLLTHPKLLERLRVPCLCGSKTPRNCLLCATGH